MIDLRRERERRGWTLEQVSHKTGVALRYLLVLERGTAELDQERLPRELLHVPESRDDGFHRKGHVVYSALSST